MERPEILWIIGIVVVGLIMAYLFAVALPRRRTRRLREEFGPEYERTVVQHGDRARAEADLSKRKARVSGLRLRSLTEPERARYVDQWEQIQARFVDEPAVSIREANLLVAEVMRARGYPVQDFDTLASDLSVNYPEFTENYRLAHDIFLRNEQGRATTEDLRQAVIHYRGVFSELLEEEPRRRAA